MGIWFNQGISHFVKCFSNSKTPILWRDIDPHFVTGWWVIPPLSHQARGNPATIFDDWLQKTSTCFHEVHQIFGEPAWLKPCFSQQIFGATFWARTWIRPGEVVAATQKPHPQRCYGNLVGHGDISWNMGTPSSHPNFTLEFFHEINLNPDFYRYPHFRKPPFLDMSWDILHLMWSYHAKPAKLSLQLGRKNHGDLTWK